ncbi:helix-turn-helix domain-containing protein [Carnobacterium antarcticum]|uniref:Helix-turn-helix domain-containing protein n=1 Tax=Carnobacterium antarcticum TaxID=2126436 RepID=A0ABW4NMM5_9LACT|nr:helix-turn-helix transcriptional regulator [Carnobacterium sp. CP1]ALV20737.1 hypothetical protein NY10_112 [Carnobacterium sp. CP1]
MTKPLKVVIGENVKRYRIEQDMTQVDLYRKIHGGTVGSFVRELERGERNITLETLDKLALALDVLVIDLVEDWSEEE